jgi:hypothetical protein
MSMGSSTGVYTAATGTLATNNGGILVGTIPGGSWIDVIDIYVYTAPTFAGTTAYNSVGLFYAPANTFNTVASPQPATLWLLAYSSTLVTGTGYSTAGALTTTVTSAGAKRAALTSAQIGPGNGVAGPQQLASLGPPEGQGFGGLTQGAAALASGDIDLYFVAFLDSGSAPSAPTFTAGEFGFKIDFTGQEG